MNLRADAHSYILAALRHEMSFRDQAPGLTWIRNERRAVLVAANAWITLHGLSTWLSEAQVERCEDMAAGHVDYAHKFALYVAEMACGATEVRP